MNNWFFLMIGICLFVLLGVLTINEPECLKAQEKLCLIAGANNLTFFSNGEFVKNMNATEYYANNDSIKIVYPGDNCSFKRCDDDRYAGRCIRFTSICWGGTPI